MKDPTTIQEIMQRLENLSPGKTETGFRFYVRVVQRISKRYTPSGTARFCSRSIPI